MITSESFRHFWRATAKSRSNAWRYVTLAFAVFIASVPGHTGGTEQSNVSARGAIAHPVLIELFTSEGCSSCPPADAFLKQLDDAGQVDGAEIIAMEEHVDYWDHQGWRDPFSSHKWTERQENYANSIGNGSVYTPQMVINGSSQLVGSSARQARQKIAEAAKTAGASLRVSVTRSSDRKVDVSATIENVPDSARSARLLLGITERGLSSNVLGGENGGRNLSHAAILRELSQVKLPKENSGGPTEGKATVSLDPSWKVENLRFVVILQDSKNLHVLAAATASLPR